MTGLRRKCLKFFLRGIIGRYRLTIVVVSDTVTVDLESCVHCDAGPLSGFLALFPKWRRKERWSTGTDIKRVCINAVLRPQV